MRRRSHLAVTLVALLTVGSSVVTTDPSGSARAADPQTELQRTQQQLAQAQATQQQLQSALEQQRAHLAQLQANSAQLSVQLAVARDELASVTAEYDRVFGLLTQVRQQVEEITARLGDLRAQIHALDLELRGVAIDVVERSRALNEREALLEEHVRSAYEQSQTSLLEVLLSADSLDEATTQVGYLLTISDQDVVLAEEIRSIRAELETRRETLKDGRASLADARAAARVEETALRARQEELTQLEAELATLKAEAERKRAVQEAALNAALQAQGNVEAQIASNERAATAAGDLAAQLRDQAAALQAAIEEAQRRAAEEAAREAERRANAVSAYGFRWPEVDSRITQEWGPTSFELEPPYTYQGVYYPHFHGGIDMSLGCGAEIRATGPGVVVASGQPLMPFDSAYGVVVDHGDGIQSWYWHLQARVVVTPGTVVTGQSVIGHEGSTGLSTGCHLHFAINDLGVWENPRSYLP
jgi:murein DD-endopeptidase MepM/ murein hydrolase activator NlpD